MKISTNLIKDFVKLSPPMDRVAERLTMAGLEVEKIHKVAESKDSVFEVEVTTNRPDWIAHLGVAREIAAVENLSLKYPSVDDEKGRRMPQGWKVAIKENEGCPYYTGVYIEGVERVVTPSFMKKTLEACGLRAIDFLVDVTNYVMLETGQPMHAFDADLLKGKEVQIRRAKKGERMVMINEENLELHENDLVIASSEGAVALAGVMGGKSSEINERTRNIFLESAYFHPGWVRKSARRHRLASDSSYRFERKVDPEGVDFARKRALYLIQKYAKPRFVSGVIKSGRKPSLKKSTIHLSVTEVEKRLGAPVKSHQISSILTRLGFEVKPDSKDVLKVRIPSFRPDALQPIDLIEEVARIYGFDHIPDVLPSEPIESLKTAPVIRLEDKAVHFFSGSGFYEAVTFSIISNQGLDAEKDLKDAVTLVNPQNKELSIMRPTLLTSLLSVVQKNISMACHGAAFFEIANTYRLKGKQSAETKVLSLMMYGDWKKKSWLDPARQATFYDLKGAIASFLQTSGFEDVSFQGIDKSYFVKPIAESVCLGGDEVGIVGEVKPSIAKLWDIETPIFFAELSLPAMVKHWDLKKKAFQDMPKYPSVARDISLLVNEGTKAQQIQSEIMKLGKGLVVQVEIFDLFRGGRVPKGHKNLAFRLIYQSPKKTLVSADVQKLHSEIAENLTQKFQAAFQ